MSEKDIEVIENNGCLRPILSLKNRDEIKKFEEEKDCFILEFNPFDKTDVSQLSLSEDFDDSGATDLCVCAEKGLVACRDDPHPRHTCAKFPFNITPHYIHCNHCYCYVCDMAAPCKTWVDHCDAFKSESWERERILRRLLKKTI